MRWTSLQFAIFFGMFGIALIPVTPNWMKIIEVCAAVALPIVVDGIYCSRDMRNGTFIHVRESSIPRHPCHIY